MQSIQTSPGDTELKGLLQLTVSGTIEQLTITCPSLAQADDIADLIDGYCQLYGMEATWKRKGMHHRCIVTVVGVTVSTRQT